MLTHSIERGVLVLRLQGDPGPPDVDALSEHISGLVHAHDPAPVVIVLGADAPPSSVEAVLRAHRRCAPLGVLLSVATHSAPVRRALEAQAGADGPPLVIHARVDTAIATAFTAAA
ncbi:hypothetical protein [Streptomyces sp. NPDC005423]|uniref:hypothetical protein n=1 Tax=Streptomyces sp. NPDC005423 TaxID=3155343 RepID=UPI0033A0E9E3